MEKFRLPHISKSVRVIVEACCRLIGPNSKQLRAMSNEVLEIAQVTHEKELYNAQNRETHHRRNRNKARRKVGPSSGLSLIRALNQVMELRERRLVVQPDDNPTVIPPQARRNSYTLAVMSAARNTDTAIITMAMMLHDYTLPEARIVYELLMQDRSRGKGDSKFYDKRIALNAALKERFEKTNSFQLEPSGKELQIGPISESEADENYAFQELIAGLLGQPIFTERFDPKTPIPKLTSSGRNNDDEDNVENRRIAAVLRPSSFDKIIESLEYTTMKQKAKGPVLNDIFSGNGHNNNGRNNPPATETQIQEDIDAVIDKYVDSNKYRCQLKYPDLEVVVDGASMSAPFAAITARNHRFELPGVAKYVQVFATENNRRTMISNLVLPDSDIEKGETWHSELQLEGRQVVTLTVEPEMDNSGNLAGSSLVVGYQPSLSGFPSVVNRVKDLWGQGRELWPAWMTKPAFAFLLGGIFLAPLITIDVFSATAPIILISTLTAYLILVGKIRPKWGMIRLQHVATDAFISLMLVAMLLFGILPIGNLSRPSTSSVHDRPAVQSPFSVLILTQDMSLYSPARSMLDTSVAISKTAGTELLAAEIVQPSINRGQTEINNDSTQLAKSKTDRAHPRHSIVQGGVFHVEVLVDTKQMIPLIGNDLAVANTLSVQTPNQPTIMKVLDNGHAQGTLVGNAVASVSDKRNTVEQPPGTVAQPTAATATPQTLALVVFDSPTQLGSLNKGDVLNANFKPMLLSATNVNASALDCSATGVVQDIKRNASANVEIRIGLSLTWVQDGNRVNSKLDLLLTDFARGKENSHYGILTIPQAQEVSIAKFESRLRKQ